MSLVLVTHCRNGILVAGDSFGHEVVGATRRARFDVGKVRRVGDRSIIAIIGLAVVSGAFDLFDTIQDVRGAGSASELAVGVAERCASVQRTWLSTILNGEYPTQECGVTIAVARVDAPGQISAAVTGTQVSDAVTLWPVRPIAQGRLVLLGWGAAARRASALMEPPRCPHGAGVHESWEAFRDTVSILAREGHPVCPPVTGALVGSAGVVDLKGTP